MFETVIPQVLGAEERFLAGFALMFAHLRVLALVSAQLARGGKRPLAALQ